MVCSVENTRWPVSAAVSAISIVSRSRISPTRIDLRRLAQRRPQRQRERRRVGVQLALVHGALLVRMQELDRILDGEDVLGAASSLIRSMIAASVDDLPEPVGPVTSTMPFFSVAQSAIAGGRPSSCDRRNRRRDHAHHDRERAALPEHVDAEAAAFGQHVRQVGGAAVFQRAQHRLVVPDQILRNARGVFRAQRRQPVDLDLHQFAVALDLRGPTRRKDQVADAGADIEHRRDDGVGGNGAGGGRSKQRRIEFRDRERRAIHSEEGSLAHPLPGSVLLDQRDCECAKFCADSAASGRQIAARRDACETFSHSVGGVYSA